MAGIVSAAMTAAVVVVSSRIVVFGVGALAAGNDVHGGRMMSLGAMIALEGGMIGMAAIVVVRHGRARGQYR